MKQTILCLVAWFLTVNYGFAQSPATAGVTSLPRIGIAGLGIESSTFSPAFTHEDCPVCAGVGRDKKVGSPLAGEGIDLKAVSAT